MIVEIDHLFNHAGNTRLVAGWIYKEFWEGKGLYSLEALEALLRQADRADRIPLSLLALVDGQPAGTVNLIENDDHARPNLRPWLAALVVLPEHRRHGIGSGLVCRLIEEAKSLHLPEVFLGTDIPAFYSRLGAVHYEQAGESLCIMRIPLAGAARGS